MKTKIQIPFLLAITLFISIACQPTKTSIANAKTTSLTPMPKWAEDATMYEVNLRQYTPEGTIAAFETHLPRLKELGVKILWIMPIQPIGEKNRKGTLGSYYSIQDYKKVNPEFGSTADFRNLVAKCHELGLKVIIDWVANHTAWDNSWITTNPDWYAKDSTGNMYGPYDWSDVAQLDYSNMDMRNAMIDAMTYWVKEADIDGFRCDVAGLVPVDFWESARSAIEPIKPIFMLAEDENQIALLHKAFNSNYGWSLHAAMNQVAKGEKTAIDITSYFAKIDTLYPTGTFPMQFTSNHDENSWNGTEYERLGGAVKTFAAFTFLCPGMPLIYSGQEAGLSKRLQFFEKDNIDWSNLEMSTFYKQLTDLKKNNQALFNGSYGAPIKFIPNNVSEKVVVFERKINNNHVVALFNFTNSELSITANTTITGNYADYFTNKNVTFPLKNELVKPFKFMIFTVK